MDAGVVAAGVVAGLSMTAAWLDLRKRTNGSGPLAQKLDDVKADVLDVKADVRSLKQELRDHLAGDGR